MPTAPALDLTDLAARIKARRRPGEVQVVGLTGSVAVGKTTLAQALVQALSAGANVASVSTDGFLLPNPVLLERGLGHRKGFPETFDSEALSALIRGARTGPVTAPGYSHVTYEIDPARSVTVDRPDILLLEGLGFAPDADGATPARDLDLLVYIDAEEADIEAWFVERFMGFWRSAEHDPASFYAQFRSMDEAQTDAFARTVWTRINLANLRDHIVQARDLADIVLCKTRDHGLTLVRDTPAASR